MWEEIEAIKTESAGARLQRIASDLSSLQANDHAQYLRVRDALHNMLERADGGGRKTLVAKRRAGARP